MPQRDPRRGARSLAASPRSLALTLAAAAAIAVVAVVPYSPVARGGFVQDDHPIVEANPVVRDGGLAVIFGSDYWAGVGGGDPGLYRPITILSFALERGADHRVDPASAHRVNLVLHALASIALFVLARRIGAGLPAAAAAGLLFASHPVHVSAVSSLVGRAEVLSALFTLAALVAQREAGPWGTSGAVASSALRRAAPWASAAFLFLALGSKETAIACPALLVVLEAVRRAPDGARASLLVRERALALAPAAGAAVAWLALRAHALGGLLTTQKVMLSDNPLSGLHGTERLGTALGLAARALGLLVAPLRLSPDYSGNVIPAERGLLAPLPIAGFLVLAGSAYLAVRAWRAGTRLEPSGPGLRGRLSIAASLFLLPYLVTGNLLVLVGVVFAERLLYLPSAGFCLLLALSVEGGVAALAARGPERAARRVGGAALAALVVTILLFAARTWSASGDWRSDEALWSAAAREEPRSPRAQFTLGKIRAEQGREDEALVHFDRATTLWPYFSSAWFEKGLILARRGDLASAEKAFRTAVSQNPNHDAAALNLGIVLHQERRLDDAAQVLRDAASRFPDSSKIAAELGHVLFDAARYGEAAEAYRRAVALGREDLAGRAREAEARAH